LGNGYAMFVENFNKLYNYDSNFNKKKDMFSEKFENCIEACYHCATKCLQCENAHIWVNRSKDHRNTIRLDCADMCLVAAKMMSAKSIFSIDVCKLCAEICGKCAEECRNHTEIEHCEDCIEACLKCAEECRKMSQDMAK
jgi:hypothetical protein